MCNCLLKLSRM
ncbi:hypothetical protein NP493_1011g01017 [Ridgeia piscesae]|uniref:Uncharacterized protein n=1 Tax=Ridgeia piscesae TaxID=27915 RepID=A0AAD9NKS4_RIDPI|nr:hypothetical protein NP493_1011g01017 [Ridgeia piscesae]